VRVAELEVKNAALNKENATLRAELGCRKAELATATDKLSSTQVRCVYPTAYAFLRPLQRPGHNVRRAATSSRACCLPPANCGFLPPDCRLSCARTWLCWRHSWSRRRRTEPKWRRSCSRCVAVDGVHPGYRALHSTHPFFTVLQEARRIAWLQYRLPSKAAPSSCRCYAENPISSIGILASCGAEVSEAAKCGGRLHVELAPSHAEECDLLCLGHQVEGRRQGAVAHAPRAQVPPNEGTVCSTFQVGGGGRKKATRCKWLLSAALQALREGDHQACLSPDMHAAGPTVK
jgi:hypothetical protein